MRLTEGIVLIGYIVAVICIGVYYARRAQSSEEEYWVAGRRIAAVVGAFAMYSHVTSASSYMGSVGLGYKFGLPMYLAYAVGVSVLYQFALYLATSQTWNTKVYTIADFFGKRYGRVAQLVGGLLTLPFMGFAMVSNFKALGLIGSYVLGVSYTAAVVITGLVVILYASIGGMWAVTITDLIQGILMVSMAVVLGSTVIAALNGPAGVFSAAIQLKPDFGLVNLPWTSYFGLWAAFAVYLIVSPMSVQRTLTAESAKAARRTVAGGNLLYMLAWIFAMFTVAGSIVAAPKLENADMALIKASEYFLPPVLSGLLLAGIVAAIMSSMDAWLLSCGSAIAHDIYGKFINPSASDRQVVTYGLVSIWVVGILMMVLSLGKIPMISVIIALVNGAMASTFAFPMILGIWWKRANLAGALAGMLSGAGVFLFLYLTKVVPLISEVVIALPVSGIVMVLVSLATKAPSTDVIKWVESLHVETEESPVSAD